VEWVHLGWTGRHFHNRCWFFLPAFATYAYDFFNRKSLGSIVLVTAIYLLDFPIVVGLCVTPSVSRYTFPFIPDASIIVLRSWPADRGIPLRPCRIPLYRGYSITFRLQKLEGPCFVRFLAGMPVIQKAEDRLLCHSGWVVQFVFGALALLQDMGVIVGPDGCPWNSTRKFLKF
jgi:hypothetical protein